jgi:hypothetical protein
MKWILQHCNLLLKMSFIYLVKYGINYDNCARFVSTPAHTDIVSSAAGIMPEGSLNVSLQDNKQK